MRSLTHHPRMRPAAICGVILLCLTAADVAALQVTDGGISVNTGSANNVYLGLTNAGINRWLVAINGPEGSANAGSDLAFNNYNDAGTQISTALLIKRSNGNVGVGTTAPETNLHVYANGRDSMMTLDQPNSPAFDSVLAFRRQSTTVWNIGVDQSDGNKMKFANGGLWNNLRTPWAVRMTIDGTGNVGIGTGSPTAKLHISGRTGNGAVIIDGSTTPDVSYIESSTGKRWGSYLNSTQYFCVASETGVADHMVVKAGGNVGIGTTNPTEKLSVNGTIRAKEVRVEATPWPDFVFEPTYRLAPLTEVAAYIQANKHLPGIPAASDVEKHGMGVSDMAVKQMAKIEELTLYAIKADGRLDALAAKAQAMESENAALKKDISALSQRLVALEKR